MTPEPTIIAIEIPPAPPEYGPPQPGQKLDNFLAFQVQRGARVVFCLDGQESPAMFHGMQWTDAGYMALIYSDGPGDGPVGICVPAWKLRLIGEEES